MADYAQMRKAIRRLTERGEDLRLPCSKPNCDGRLRSVEGGLICSHCLGHEVGR